MKFQYNKKRKKQKKTNRIKSYKNNLENNKKKKLIHSIAKLLISMEDGANFCEYQSDPADGQR